MAVDQNATKSDKDPKVGKVVTLEVSPEGAEVLALALEMGEITLALKRLGDTAVAGQAISAMPTTDVRISRTLQRLNGLSMGRPVQNSEQEGTDIVPQPVTSHNGMTSVRIYRGADQNAETVSVPTGAE